MCAGAQGGSPGGGARRELRCLRGRENAPGEEAPARTREKGPVLRGDERFGPRSPRASQAGKKFRHYLRCMGTPLKGLMG